MNIMELFRQLLKLPDNDWYERHRRWRKTKTYQRLRKHVENSWIWGMLSTLLFIGPAFLAVVAAVTLTLTFSSFMLLEIPEDFE